MDSRLRENDGAGDFWLASDASGLGQGCVTSVIKRQGVGRIKCWPVDSGLSQCRKHLDLGCYREHDFLDAVSGIGQALRNKLAAEWKARF